MHRLTHEIPVETQREEIDPVFKQVLVDNCGQLNISIKTQVEVSRLPRTMDVLIHLSAPQEFERVQLQTPFGHFLTHNQVEFKGRRDNLTIAGYHLIFGRTHLYIGEQDINPEQMTVTIVCARKPRKVLYHCKEHLEFEKLPEKGYYLSSTKPPVYVIAINELAEIPRNYPLLLFAASEEKFRRFLRKNFQERNFQYVRYAYAVRPSVTKEELAMARRHYRLSEEELEFIAQDIGAELMPFFSPEVRLQGLSTKEKLRGLSTKEKLRGLSTKEKLQGLSPEEKLNGLSRRELLRYLSTETQQRSLTAEERRILQQLLESPEENSESTMNKP